MAAQAIAKHERGFAVPNNADTVARQHVGSKNCRWR
jgi:hypothetical protein